MPPTDSHRLPPSVALWLSAQRTAFGAVADTVRTASVFSSRLADAASVDVGQTPSEVVYRENKLELHRYESLTDDSHDVPLLVVYALINRPFVLDLQPDRSVVRRLLEAGHDVYLIDWGEPSLLDTSLGLGDYVDRYLDNCVDVICERAGVSAINLLGYCMGGTLSAIYAARHPGKVNALGLMATGLYFDDTGGILEQWGGEDHYDPWALVETYGNVPGEFLDVGFDLMDPVANTVTKYARLADHVENEDFVENFARMERWLDDSVDVAGTVYAEFVEDIYQQNRLAENELVVGGERVDIENIDMPMVQILGAYDHLVPPAASTPFNDRVGSDDVTTIEYPTGHVGLAMSTSSHRDLWPEVAEWYLDQSDRPGLADVFGEAIERALGVDVETDVTVGGVDEVEISIAERDHEVARALVHHDVVTIEAFLEDALDVAIGLETGADGIAVTVETAEGVVTTVVENVGEAIRTEVEEAVGDRDVAASYDLEDVDGIGPTYAGRLRAVGVESVSALAVTDARRVATAAKASEQLARQWITRARALVGADDDQRSGS